jgi:hypothetical protein
MKLGFASLSLTLLLANAPTIMPRSQDDQLKSRAEQTNYEETSRYEDVARFIDELQKRTDKLRVESFGKTEEGRDLPLMVFADPPIARPQEARASGKPVIFIQANIHAGEVEGKEATLHLARRIAIGDLRSLLNNLVILIAPIYNADGNEKISLNNRTAQYGPIGGVGTRENAKGFDLNRDYMKLETPEANALVALFNRWDPHLTVDLHTTNGSYHGYHLTYAPTLNPNADARLIAFERNKMLPAITRSMIKAHKFRIYYYGNFATKERMNRELNTFEMERSGGEARPADKPETKIWRTFDHRPRFGNNYCGLRNRLTILSEAYSYLDFKGRVAVTEAFVEEIFKYSALHADEITALIKRVDDDVIRGRVGRQGVEFELKPLEKPASILVGEVEQAHADAHARLRTLRRNEEPRAPSRLHLPQRGWNEERRRQSTRTWRRGRRVDRTSDGRSRELHHRRREESRARFSRPRRGQTQRPYAKRDGSIPFRLDSGSNLSTIRIAYLLPARSGERRRIRELEFSRLLP